MTSMDDFEKSLREIVSAKRLSASKMNALTENTMKLLEHDTQLVSILYRTHKAMPPASKVSSLYVMDAICRAARHITNKHNSSNTHGGKGNSATFLSKFEAVLDGVFQDILLHGGPEGKEKSKKIIDIWTKGSTFSKDVLSRLSERIKDPDKEANGKAQDPRVVHQTIAPTVVPMLTSAPPASAPIPALSDAQTALLTLLAQAASSSGPVPSSGLNPQLAMLQQLKAAQGVDTDLHHIAAPPSNPLTPIPQLPFNQPPQQHNHFAGPSGSSREYERDDHRRDGPERGGRYNDEYEQPHRGGFRGRGRGRGGYSRGRWDEHPRGGDRFQDRGSPSPGVGPPGRRRSSRSRSPSSSRFRPSGDSTGEVRPYSPPNRPSMVSPPLRVSGSGDPRKKPPSVDTDEFGREIRSGSVEPPPGTPTTTTNNGHHHGDASTGSMSMDQDEKSPPPVSAVSASDHNYDSSPFHAAATTPVTSSQPKALGGASGSTSGGGASIPSGGGGLETFDATSFDPTLPASWEALGKLWQITNGVIPTTEQLMQFLMMIQSGATPTQIVAQAQMAWAQTQTQTQTPTQTQWTDQQGGEDGGEGGDGGGGYGSGGSKGTWPARESHSDAMVVGGGGGGDRAPSTASTTTGGGGGGLGGSMQKVGDKWVFVRNGAAPS